MTDEKAFGLGGIRALAFDAYGTLFDVFSVTALCERLFPGNGTALAGLWRSKQLQYSLLRTVMERYRDFWQVTADALGFSAEYLKLELTASKQRELMDAYLTLSAFSDVKPGLEALRNSGLRLAILSNGAPAMLQGVVAHAGIAPLLDGIVSVDEIKEFKPSPRVYRLGPAALKVDRSELGFVSSNSWDVCGAAAAGLKTFWIQRNSDEPAEALGYSAGQVIRTITELAAMLQR